MPEDTLLERAKFFRDHVATVLNLATGSLVLSVTFLHDRVGSLQNTWLLKRSWWFLVVSILFGVAYNYTLNVYVREEAMRYKILLRVISFVFHVTFFVAICYLFRFGMKNV